MRGSEFKSIQPSSILLLVFSGSFIIALIYSMAVNLDLMPWASLSIVSELKSKIALFRPIPKALACALAAGLMAGVGGTLLALIYNIFAGIFGGIRADIRSEDEE